MPCFTELPPELIYNIFTYLLLPTITKRPIFWVAKLCPPLDSPARREVAEAYSTARALANTCRLFRTVAQNVRLHRYEASFADVRTDVLRHLRQERHLYSRIMEIRIAGSSKIGHRCKTGRHRQAELREEIDLLHPMEATQNIVYNKLAQFPAHVELALLIISLQIFARSACMDPSLICTILRKIYLTKEIPGCQSGLRQFSRRRRPRMSLSSRTPFSVGYSHSSSSRSHSALV